ncbi:MAG: hypothetical protein RR135_05475, partial [Oscillospiraceae bacterium]
IRVRRSPNVVEDSFLTIVLWITGACYYAEQARLHFSRKTQFALYDVVERLPECLQSLGNFFLLEPMMVLRRGLGVLLVVVLLSLSLKNGLLRRPAYPVVMGGFLLLPCLAARLPSFATSRAWQEACMVLGNWPLDALCQWFAQSQRRMLCLMLAGMVTAFGFGLFLRYIKNRINPLNPVKNLL